jgi:hypothetical protein
MLSIAEKRLLWGDGPWLDEPDLVEWRERTLPCVVVRNPGFGTLCGYVAVPPGHPLHGVDEHERLCDLQVHGGITYAGPRPLLVCYTPLSGEPDDLHWFGFDTVHSGDLIPSLDRERGGTYRTLAYMIEQVDRMALQLSKVRP